MSGGEGTWLQVSNSETHPRELEAALSGPRVSLCLTASSALTVLLKAPSANSDGEEFDIFFLPSRELSGCLVPCNYRGTRPGAWEEFLSQAWLSALSSLWRARHAPTLLGRKEAFG